MIFILPVVSFRFVIIFVSLAIVMSNHLSTGVTFRKGFTDKGFWEKVGGWKPLPCFMASAVDDPMHLALVTVHYMVRLLQ